MGVGDGSPDPSPNSKSTEQQEKPSFHMLERSQTVGDFTVSRPSQSFPRYGKFEAFIGDRRRFYLSGEVGNWCEAIELKLLPTSPTGMIADYRRNLGQVVKIETLPISLRPSIGDVHSQSSGILPTFENSTQMKLPDHVTL